VLCWEVANVGWVLQFRANLPSIVREQWYKLASKLNNIELNDEVDIPVWKWSKNGRFSVKSVYMYLTKDENGPRFSKIWKAKLPEKIKIFMWMLVQKVILTKDNMLRKRWKGNPGCYFCGDVETVNHLMFTCPVAKVIWGFIDLCFNQNDQPSSYEQFWPWVSKALPGGDHVYMFGLATICWAIWKARNRLCFEKKTVKDPTDIIFFCLCVNALLGRSIS
jgi:hypothetical protein